MRPRSRRALPVILAAALAAGCGKGPPSAPPPSTPSAPSPAAKAPEAPSKPAGPTAEEAAAAAKESAAKEAAVKEAAAKAAAATEESAKRDSARAEALRLLKETRAGEEPAARAAAVEAAAAKGRAFLEAGPGADPEGEVAGGTAGAEAEAKHCRAYAEAFAHAQAALDAKDWGAARAAAEEAIRIFPREEARTARLEALRGSAPKGMMYVPAGPALPGRGKDLVNVEAFYIERTEVTCRQFDNFLIATESPPPPGWTGYSPPAGKGEHPVTSVTGEQAAAYAKWAGRRLPTEVEWEKAARGTDGRAFPWGETFDAEKGNFGKGGTRAAGGSPGDLSPFGLLDAGGNVAEFTVPVHPFRAPTGPQKEEDKPRWVVKGGHWGDAKPAETSLLFLRFPAKAGEKDSGTGFRCALDSR